MNVSLKLVGKLDTTINLESSLNKEFGADCAPSDLSGAALSPKMIEAMHSPSECGITIGAFPYLICVCVSQMQIL